MFPSCVAACPTAIVKCVLACLYALSALLGEIHVFMLHTSCFPYHPLVGSVLVVLRTGLSNQMAYFRVSGPSCPCGGVDSVFYIWLSGFHPNRAFVACPASSNTSWMAATLLETELIKTDIKLD